ncbi:hypothetical protein AB0F43_31970 [Kribbella sp. NPDC023972]|uniref:hypothetical protein n=1 Tax=Kribbella sp. NPDC023972 TaxID=3154795 RepID=UPI0033EBB87E
MSGQGSARRANPTAAPVQYAEFVRVVAQFKTTKLLRLLASVAGEQWQRPSHQLVDVRDPILPHAASLVAMEALGSWGRHGQTTPTRDDLRYLSEMVVGLDDPFASSADEAGRLADGALDDLLLRVGFQQFAYQQPVFNDTARLRPMLSRPFPADRFRCISAEVITQLLGTDLDTYIDLQPLFLAAVMVNRGQFNAAWLDQPNFGELTAHFPPADILAVYEAMTRPGQDLRRLIRPNRHPDPRMRQYDFNPLVASPFVGLPDGTSVAPQPFFVTGRFTPSALYYAGIRRFGNDFATDLGYVNEDYVLAQLGQLRTIGQQVDGEIEWKKGRKTVDATVVAADQVVLVEVKSVRPILSARADFASYTAHLARDIKKAVEQLIDTYDLWKAGNPHLDHLPAYGSTTVSALIVVPEPLYLVNHTAFRATLPPAPFSIAIISMTELEHLVACALHEHNATVLANAARPHPGGIIASDVQGVLLDAQRRAGGKMPRNPLLDAAFDAMRIRSS